jgi:mono/diheme cytochrome c family protein
VTRLGLVHWLGASTLSLLVGACTNGLPAPSDIDRERVVGRWPDVRTADLEHGRMLYAARCARCHALYEPAAYPAAHWEGAVHEMRTRAGLSEAEERFIVQYLVSVSSRPADPSATKS